MRRFVLAFFGLACTQFLAGQSRTDRSFHPQIPKAWTDAAKTYELPLSYGKRAEHILSEPQSRRDNFRERCKSSAPRPASQTLSHLTSF
ncbi:MAG: hypothetical protein DMG11_34700 [Acidobacteria bacterium]|nr:MAG: hypothetical protein DMG11_34700 [Acidobacteriota bacterium]